MREMKDSGVEWIGEIPKDWEITQTRRLFRNEKNIDSSDCMRLFNRVQRM